MQGIIEPKAVIFDYGNVLCAPQRASDVNAMAGLVSVSAEEFLPMYWRHRVAYDEARLDANAYWSRIAADAHTSIDERRIQDLIAIDVESWCRPSPVMVEWAKQLRAAGLRTAVLSNMPVELRSYLMSAVPWFPEFDHLTFSCDLGIVKPRPGIYESCLEGLGVSAGEALFLDDRPDNIRAAEALGIHAVVFTTPEGAIAALDGKFSLPVIIEC